MIYYIKIPAHNLHLVFICIMFFSTTLCFSQEKQDVKPKPAKLIVGFSGSGVRSSSPPIKSNTNVNPNLSGMTLKNNINFSPSLFVEANYGRWGFITEAGYFKSTINFDAENYLSKISSFTNIRMNEKKWSSSYVEARQDWLANHRKPELHATVYRTQGYLKQIKAGNWELSDKVLMNGDLSRGLVMEE